MTRGDADLFNELRRQETNRRRSNIERKFCVMSDRLLVNIFNVAKEEIS